MDKKKKKAPKAKKDTCFKDVYLGQTQRKHTRELLQGKQNQTNKQTKKQICKFYPTIKLRLSRSRRAAYRNKCFDDSIWSMFLGYLHIWNFKIMGWKTSKTKELWNPASVWNTVLSEMFLLRNWQSFRVPPLQRAPCKVLGEAPAMWLPCHMF